MGFGVWGLGFGVWGLSLLRDAWPRLIVLKEPQADGCSAHGLLTGSSQGIYTHLGVCENTGPLM